MVRDNLDFPFAAFILTEIILRDKKPYLLNGETQQ
jgi:hypothetical protein